MQGLQRQTPGRRCVSRISRHFERATSWICLANPRWICKLQFAPLDKQGPVRIAMSILTTRHDTAWSCSVLGIAG